MECPFRTDLDGFAMPGLESMANSSTPAGPLPPDRPHEQRAATRVLGQVMATSVSPLTT